MLNALQLSRALENMEPPPCIGCQYATRCGQELLACRLFAEYIDTPGVFADTPTRGAYLTCFPEDDREKLKAGGRENPTNKSQLKTRVCEVCGTEYEGIKKHFGLHTNVVCTPCRQKHGRTKVCRSCGRRRPTTEFRLRIKRGERIRASRCDGCREVKP